MARALLAAVVTGGGAAAAQEEAAFERAGPREAWFERRGAWELTCLELRHAQARRREGWVLLGWGLASVVAGSVMAGAGHDDEGWLTAGVTTVSWGAVNAALALTLAQPWAPAPEADRDLLRLRGPELAAARARRLREQQRAAQIFALNTGLDVAYMVAGALLLAFRDEVPARRQALTGAGGTFIVQGAGLLLFDVFGWRQANHQAGELLPAAHTP